MRRTRVPVIVSAAGVLLASLLVATGGAAPAGARVPARAPVASAARGDAPTRATGAYVLTATHRGKRYAPTFTGNGYLGVRVPPAGQGYAGGTVPAQSEIAGFYAKPPKDVQQRANLPTWSTLGFRAGRDAYSLHRGKITGRRQQLDLHDGVITTTLRWRAPNGRVTDLAYQVFTDRSRAHIATVRLTFTPHWTGNAAVTDRIDGRPATLTRPHSRGWSTRQHEIWESVRTEGTRIVAGLSSRLSLAGAASPVRTHRVVPSDKQSIGQRLGLRVQAGHTYRVTKYVGIATSNESTHPVRFARRQSADAEHIGFAGLHREDRAAWGRLWAGHIDVLGNPELATQVNASEFYLWSSTRAGVDWSISPAGLSSNGYDGHIFWDAETWMHPSLLAQHPELAAAMDAYRYQRLGAARRHARATGYRGARFPWESALDGTEQIPPPVSVNSEGLYEMHITADIALAQWQYYLASGDRQWLRRRGWPVLAGAARFWASKAVRGKNGSYHINHVTGPDEENPDVNDEAYTNVAAARTLRIATAAARLLGRRAPASWAKIAAGLVLLYDPAKHIHPEFRGYRGQMVKQADVTMLQYPWQRKMPATVAQHDLNYYVPRSDPGGPSMSDAINMIDTASLGSPGCASYVYTERSILPFMRDVFDQFSETRTGGAFTFMTGIGGFLQEFLYGYSGLRINAHSVAVDPSMNRQLRGVVLHRLQWRGRQFTIAIGDSRTRVSLDSGPAMPVDVRGHRRVLTQAGPLIIRTRRPDTTPTRDVVRCAPARASSAQRGAIALAAVDGSPATDWQPSSVPARLRVPLNRPHTISHATVLWGRAWPPAPKPNVPPPPKPVRTLRPAAYQLLASTNGHRWRVIARMHTTSKRTTDRLTFAPVRARYVELRITKARKSAPHPMLEELTVTH
ncbi:MAG TPA: glycosyl hydrolase family 65 protein [Jatrophihabitans sp.]|nr:glycosyl hydrolase family 65 protein [Jatrophihabitans sp.]